MKRSVAVVIERSPAAESVAAHWLLVLRPPDDQDLPDIWGLPAGSFREGETLVELVTRIGAEKLGVDLALGAVLAEGESDRGSVRLHMTLCSAEVLSGRPVLDRTPVGVTRYVEWGWREPATLAAGAAAGSLCCRLGLRAAGAQTAP